MSPTLQGAERLATLIGIAADYQDVFGERVELPSETRLRLAAELGFPSETADALADSLRRLDALRNSTLPRTIPITAEASAEIPLKGTLAETVLWQLTDERGGTRSGKAETRTAAGRSVLRLPALPAGYHQLTLTVGGSEVRSLLVAAPDRAWQPDWMRRDGDERKRHWGMAAQVYSFHSESNLGIGSYTDVRGAAEGAAQYGASFLGLSPVHALFQSDRGKTSPYSPSSRLFLETLHIDPTAIEGFAGSEAARQFGGSDTQSVIDALRASPLVDHRGVWAVLSPLLETLWSERKGSDDPGFASFRQSSGVALERHATFEALSEHFKGQGAQWLGEWPDPFRDAGSAEVARFAIEHGDRISYYAWLQYVADRQLGNAAETAKRSGMSVGLYRDLAVGSDRGGSELWSAPERFAGGLSIGAPPDLLAPNGQDWGIPPINPIALEEGDLAAFRDLVRANMRHSGAIRIDHAFQLRRLYLIPTGEGGQAGAYVDYPFASLLAVLRLESHRAKALVIMEDLGTGPEGFSAAIMKSGMLSYRVLAFERDASGNFIPPDAYPREALSVVTTHDLPTFAGWWRGLDTDLRQALALYDPDRAEKERGERVGEREKLIDALVVEGLMPAGSVVTEAPPAEAVTRYLARTASVLNAVQYEDVVGALNQPNMPGTTEGHPNWRRKLEMSLDEIDAPGGPLARIGAAIAAEGRGRKAGQTALAAPPPRATYRFQFHKDFTFDDAIKAVPYLKKLGVSHVYSSPIQTARPGSTHGYDIVDHTKINPELGGEDGFLRLSDALKTEGLGLLLDIVPNHMGVGGSDNAWWLSALEWGPLSPYAATFDIDWERLGAGGKLVVPVLGKRYGDALEDGDLKLKYDPEAGAFAAWHYDDKLPLSPLSYPLILDRALATVDDLSQHADLIAVSDRLRAMGDETSSERRAGFVAEAENLKTRIAANVSRSGDMKRAVERALALINGVPGLPESFGTLHRILEMQSYRPSHWRVAASEINYRRFFDINTLAGIRVELPDVFGATHALIFRLVREGRIEGLRIDHVDGLADPEGYLAALQREVGPGFYVLVEKILEPGEPMRPWPVAGTTGYDALNVIDGIFVHPASAEAFDGIYRDFSGIEDRYFDQLRAAKAEITASSFASELEVLCSDLKRIADADRRTRDYTIFAMRIVLTEIIARFPVYRSYLTDGPASPEDIELVSDTIAAAKRTSRLPDRSLHDFVEAVLLGRIATEAPGRPTAEHLGRFRRRFQQLTGPIMAKSLEDTLFYRYARLISLNEVGGDPGHFGTSTVDFHRENAARAQAWPAAMVASATHDTKRGEDARGRISALSQDPDVWRQALADWSERVAPLLTDIDGAPAPDRNDQSFLLQSLLGAWPLDLLENDDAKELEAFRSRFLAFAEKAFREAKRHTSWTNTNEPYEAAVKRLIEGIVSPGSAVLAKLGPLAQRLAEDGMRFGLVRTALKCTLPGVPDIYQGTGFWDFSFVDPDNRRPVDYRAREKALDDASPIDALLASWPDGRIKQRVLHRLLEDRAAAPRLYAQGDYRPLEPTGPLAEALIAFERREGDERLIVLARRATGSTRLGSVDSSVTRLALAPGRWLDVIGGREIAVEGRDVEIGELFANLPVAVLRRTA